MVKLSAQTTNERTEQSTQLTVSGAQQHTRNKEIQLVQQEKVMEGSEEAEEKRIAAEYERVRIEKEVFWRTFLLSVSAILTIVLFVVWIQVYKSARRSINEGHSSLASVLSEEKTTPPELKTLINPTKEEIKERAMILMTDQIPFVTYLPKEQISVECIFQFVKEGKYDLVRFTNKNGIEVWRRWDQHKKEIAKHFAR